MVSTLWGGTQTMRAAGHEFLPKEPLEGDSQYANRLARSFLVNYFKSAITDIVARPFAKPVQWNGGTNTKLFAENPTGEGYDMTRFMRIWMQSAIKYGVSHCLIDGSAQPADTLDQLELPTAKVIPPTSVIGWTWDPTSRVKRLTSVRILEEGYEEKDETMKPVEQVRKFTDTEWFVYREGKKGWEIFAQGNHTFGRVPLITMNLNGEFMTADPPLMDLASLNVAHWQSSSDQRNALRFARIGIMFMSGVTKQEIDNMIAVGPNKISWSANEKADAKYVEHSGAAMKIGADDLDKLEQQMEQLGVRPLVERSASSTATGKSIDESRSQTTAQVWAGIAQDAGEQLMEAAASWLSESVETATLSVFTEFDSTVNAPDDKDRLMKLRAMGDLDRVTHLELQQRRGLLPDNLNVKEVAAKAEAEGVNDMTGGTGDANVSE